MKENPQIRKFNGHFKLCLCLIDFIRMSSFNMNIETFHEELWLPTSSMTMETPCSLYPAVLGFSNLEDAPCSFDFDFAKTTIRRNPDDQNKIASPSNPVDTSIVERIPRPPNAFMLFRSDFLRQGTIPKSVEKRQHALSRVAGEVWQMMSAEEKGFWHLEAARKQREHKEKYPNYKFTPSPRGTRRNRDGDNVKSDKVTAASPQKRTQHLREKYTNFLGPSPSSSRSNVCSKKFRGVDSSISSVDSTHLSLSRPRVSSSSLPYGASEQHSILSHPSTLFGFNECPYPPPGQPIDFDSDKEMFANLLGFDMAVNDTTENWAMDNSMSVSNLDNPDHHQLVQPLTLPTNTTASSDEMIFEQFCDSTFLDATASNQGLLSFPFSVDNAFTPGLTNPFSYGAADFNFSP